jgi:GDP-4-dehydro-6-deoxy-D-mannose reductase
VYGAVPPSELPITEDVPLTPVSPYAASKAAAEMLGIRAAVGFGLPIVQVRPFNHIGPGRSADFVVSALAKRIVQAQRSGEGVTPVGNLSARRDFTDVRDVVKAYRRLGVRGQAGEVSNISSGESVGIASIARARIRLARVEVTLECDESLFVRWSGQDAPATSLGCRQRRAGSRRPLSSKVSSTTPLGYWRSEGSWTDKVAAR